MKQVLLALALSAACLMTAPLASAQTGHVTALCDAKADDASGIVRPADLGCGDAAPAMRRSLQMRQRVCTAPTGRPLSCSLAERALLLATFYSPQSQPAPRLAVTFVTWQADQTASVVDVTAIAFRATDTGWIEIGRTAALGSDISAVQFGGDGVRYRSAVYRPDDGRCCPTGQGWYRLVIGDRTVSFAGATVASKATAAPSTAAPLADDPRKAVAEIVRLLDRGALPSWTDARFGRAMAVHMTPELIATIARGSAIAGRDRLNLWDGDIVTGAQGLVRARLFASQVVTRDSASAVVRAKIGTSDTRTLPSEGSDRQFSMRKIEGIWLVDDIRGLSAYEQDQPSLKSLFADPRRYRTAP